MPAAAQLSIEVWENRIQELRSTALLADDPEKRDAVRASIAAYERMVALVRREMAISGLVEKVEIKHG